MRRQKKFLPYLYLFLLTLPFIGLLLFFIDPASKFTVFDANFSPLIFLIFLLFVSSFNLLTFVFAHTRRGFLGGAFITGLLLLRYFGQANPYQVAVLIIITFLIEFLYSRRTR